MTSGEPHRLAGTPPQQAEAPVQTWPDGQAPASAKQLWRQTGASCEPYTHCVGTLHDRSLDPWRWDGELLEPLPHPASRTPMQTAPLNTSQYLFIRIP
jgi:hypothetical protein